MTAPRERLYRWWPRYSPGNVELGAAGLAVLLRTGAGLMAVALVLCLPPVVDATSLTPNAVVALFGAFFACMVINDYVLHPLASTKPAWFNVQLVVTPLYNVVFFTLLVLLPGDPSTPLWMGLLLYTCTTAAWQEIDASVPHLALHVLAPLCTIPYFRALDSNDGWAIGGPALCATVSAVAYHIGAGVKVAWRAVRWEQATAIETLRSRNAQLERHRIAQDLHDSVGSSLAIFGLSADLVEQHAGRPAELRLIAANLRSASREGLSELRGMLDSMAPETTSFGDFGQALRRAALRMREVSGKPVEVTVKGDATAAIDGPVRLAAMRIFQESVNNALRHGLATRLDVLLSVEQRALSMSVVNDGTAWVASDLPTTGRGVSGMRERATQLGGRFTIANLADGRTEVSVVLPLPA